MTTAAKEPSLLSYTKESGFITIDGGIRTRSVAYACEGENDKKCY